MIKKTFFLLLAAAFTVAAQAQDNDIKPAAKGMVYGTPAAASTTSVNPDDVVSKMVNSEFNGRVTGKVSEVCQAMGCWFKLQKADGTTLMIKTKDHAFFLPQNLVGKTVAVDGTAKVKEVSEAQRKHLAEDSGKSKEEIAKIKGPEKQVQMVAAGVQVLD